MPPDADFVIYNETYRVLVCQRCQISIRSLYGHLFETHGAELLLLQRYAILDRFADKALLDQETATLDELPRPYTAPVPDIQVYRNGLACTAYPKVLCGEKGIVKHCKREHGWGAHRGPGRPQRQRAEAAMWRTD
ncbi:hypothetical protein MMC21_005851, partial [Puttea exsequens]|nr:hypothetical protein [Puttea exsequens]